MDDLLDAQEKYLRETDHTQESIGCSVGLLYASPMTRRSLLGQKLKREN